MQNEPKPDQTAANNTLNPIARRNARRYALQAMYQWQLANTPISEIEYEFVTRHINKTIDMAYFKELIHGVPQQLTDIDQEMRPFLGRPQHEIDAVELAVLRLATYELRNRLDVPYRVVINEALQLTKKFGSIEGYKFVNGVLDRIAKKIRVVEINMANK